MAGCDNDPDGCGLIETPGDASVHGFVEAADNRIGIETAAFGLKKSERRFQDIVGGCPSERREVNRQRPVFGCMPRLERLGHGTEIISEASAFGSDHAESILCLQWIQASQLGAGRGAAKRSASAGGMKALIVMTGRNGLGNLAFNFHADVVGQHQIFSRSPSQLTDCECWREHSHRGVREKAVNAVLRRGQLRIVEIIGVNGNSVGKRREARMRLHCGANDAGLHIAHPKRLHILTHQRRHGGTRAGQRQSKTVQNRLLAQIDYVPRNVLVLRVDDEFGDILGKPRRFRKFRGRDWRCVHASATER